MRTFAHVINPVIKPPEHELAVAQPITFESMRAARERSAAPDAIELIAVTYPEDESLVPPYFRRTAPLEVSFRDLNHEPDGPKLPRGRDILERAAAATAAEYLIYSNVDIGLMPFFYDGVDALLADGWDSVIVNRRTIHPKAPAKDNLLALWMLAGDPHPGYDCFVFPRAWLAELELGEVCLGLPGFDWLLAVNIWLRSKRNFTFADGHMTFHIGDDMAWRSERYLRLVAVNDRFMPEPLAQLRARYGDDHHLDWPRKGLQKGSLFSRALNRLGRELVTRFPSTRS